MNGGEQVAVLHDVLIGLASQIAIQHLYHCIKHSQANFDVCQLTKRIEDAITINAR